MTVIAKSIILPKEAENTQTTQYTATNVRARIDKFTITNTSSANVLFSCNLVPLGEVPDNSNLIVKSRAIAPNETYSAVELVGQILEVGGVISTLAGAASALTISASGVEIT